MLSRFGEHDEPAALAALGFLNEPIPGSEATLELDKVIVWSLGTLEN